MTCQWISLIAQSYHWSSHDCRLLVHLHTPSLMASMCISQLVSSQPVSLQNHGLQLHFQTSSITASKCISNLIQLHSATVLLSSHNLGHQGHHTLYLFMASIQVNLQTGKISTPKGIWKFTRFTASHTLHIALKCCLHRDWPYVNGLTHLVLATGLGNPPAVRVMTGSSVWLSSRPSQKPESHLSWRVVTWPGHRTADICPLWNRTAVPNLLFLHLWLQFSIWVLIVLWHDQSVDSAEWWALSPPSFRFVIQVIFVEWVWKKAQFSAKFAGFRSRLHKYWSYRIWDPRRWKYTWNCTIYVLIISQYDQNSNTQLESNLWGWNAGFLVVKPAQLQPSGFSCGKNSCNSSVLVPTLTRNRSSRLEPLLKLGTPRLIAYAE